MQNREQLLSVLFLNAVNTDMNLIELLSEGRYDKNIFKIIFMAGGPGSGKTRIAKSIKSAFGLKYINVDDFVEMLSPRYDIDLKTLYSGEFYDKTRMLTRKQRFFGIKNRLGLLLDGTGTNTKKTESIKQDLESIGYHAAIVYVNIDLETALYLNEQRIR